MTFNWQLLSQDIFHAFGPQRLVSGQADDWYRKYHPPAAIDYSRSLADGLACVSENTVSFHYVEVG